MVKQHTHGGNESDRSILGIEMENPFAMPPPLFTRKRKGVNEEAPHKTKEASFFTTETYHAYSVDGSAYEAELFQGEQTRRAAIRAALAHTTHATNRNKATVTNKTMNGVSSVVMNIKPVVTAVATATPAVAAKPIKHLASLVLERSAKERSREIAQAMNIAKRLSNIPVADHIAYMALHQKRTAALAGGIPALLALTADEHAALSRLEIVAKQEQTAFEEDLERLAKKEKLADYSMVPVHIEQLYDQCLHACRNQVMHLYPRYYENQLSVALRSSSVSTAERSASAMKHLQEVAVEGTAAVIPAAMLSDLSGQSGSTGMNLDPLVTRVQISEGPIHAEASTWRAISADPTAERLMEVHSCDVALSSSTLLAIFDTADDEINTQSMGWTIPVKSRVCVVKGKPRRQLYLDRPLPNAYVCAREKIVTMSHPLAIQALTNSTEPKLARRVTYHVWQMGDIKLLIRTATHVFVHQDAAPTPAAASASAAAKTGAPSTAPITTTTKTKPVSVFLKSDYTPLGIPEQITPSELRRMWLHSWIRGGSALLLGRLTPKSSTIANWSKYSLSSLLQSLGSPGFPDTFEPLDYFAVLHTVLTSLQGLSGANYLLQCPMRPPQKQTQRFLHILRAAVDSGHAHQTPLPQQPQPQQQQQQQASHFDLFQYINACGQTNLEPMGYILPTWQPVPDRIPYTYRTGVHCTEYLQRGICQHEGEGGNCENVHLRFVFFNKTEIKWQFEDHTTGAAARRSNANPRQGGKRTYPKLTPSFPFCRGRPQYLAAKLLANPHAAITCDTPQDCQLPHLTLHQIAERVADEALRTARVRRKTHKSKNRGRHRNNDSQGHHGSGNHAHSYDDWEY